MLIGQGDEEGVLENRERYNWNLNETCYECDELVGVVNSATFFFHITLSKALQTPPCLLNTQKCLPLLC